MPSQVVDDLWHEFILYTRNYALFCRRAFGGFLHHTPAAALGAANRSNEGLRRGWWQACREEHINPHRPSRLPLLFAIDRKLGIQNGFIYMLECSNPGEVAKMSAVGWPIHCAADLKPVKGGTVHAGASCGGGGCSTGGAHGCSGSDCSGGCGGGGD